MRFGSYGRSNRGAIGAYNSARLEASFRLRDRRHVDEVFKEQRPVDAHCTAAPPALQLFLLAAQAAVCGRDDARIGPGEAAKEKKR